MSQTRCCRYCQQSFQLSIYRPQQSVCSRPECQRRRRADYHRQKLQSDPEYAQVVGDSRKKWRQAHPGYCKQYRQSHPEYVEQNRLRQRRRDHKRRLLDLAKNNLAFDLKRCSAEVWLLGPDAKDLAKNNVAPCQVFILQSVAPAARATNPS